MRPIRDLLDRIRERRMERMSSRTGLFPRLRNLINPLDSQGMMDRAQGTQVGGGGLSKPLTYTRVIQDPQADAAQPAATPMAAVAGTPVGKAPKPMTPQQQDEAAIQRLAPTDPLDPVAGAAHLTRQAAVLTAQAKTLLQSNPTEAMRMNLEARELRAEAGRTLEQARQRKYINEDAQAAIKMRAENSGPSAVAKQKVALAKQVESGELSAIDAAHAMTDATYDDPEKQPSPQQYQMTFDNNVRSFVGPSAARQIISGWVNGEAISPQSPLFGELSAGFGSLPPDARVGAMQQHLAPHIASGYVRVKGDQIKAQQGGDLTLEQAAKLNTEASKFAAMTISKLNGTGFPEGEKMLGKTREALGGTSVHDTVDSFGANAVNLFKQGAQSIGPSAAALLRTFMAPQPSASAAPVAAPMAPPVAQPAPQVAPRRPVPTYPNGQPRKMPTPIPDYRK